MFTSAVWFRKKNSRVTFTWDICKTSELLESTCVFSRWEVGSRMSSPHRINRSFVSCVGNQLLYTEAIQSVQESRQLQLHGLWFITSLQRKAILVVAKVRHSQHINDTSVPIWIITNNEGTVSSAHCLACKAGLAECCSHIESVLYYIKAGNRIQGKLACTQVKCAWLLPTYLNEVPYSKVKWYINFKSAKKSNIELLDRINDLCQSFTSQKVKPTLKPVVEEPIPSKAEMKAQFSEVNKSSKKLVILSLVPEFSEQFVLKSRWFPTLPDLYNHDNLTLGYPKLLEKCGEIRVPLSDSYIDLVEHDTRKQSHGAAFFRHRAGRVVASTSCSVAHTNPAPPSISLIKNICYPQPFRAKSKAINHSIKMKAKPLMLTNLWCQQIRKILY